MKQKIFNISIIVASLLMATALIFIYLPSFSNFFWGDDFYNIWISAVSGPLRVFGYFNLFTPSSDFPFYRPLTTQLFYFFISKNGTYFNPLPAHLMMFIGFLSSGLLVYLLSLLLTKRKNISFLTCFFYLFSATHFYRLYYLSQFQEIGLTIFFLSTAIFYILYLQKNQTKFLVISNFMFVFGLFSKESILTVLPILLTIRWYLKKPVGQMKSLLGFVVISLIYIVLRIGFFGFATGGDYQMIFAPISILNNYFWYAIWSLGFPEDLVNLNLFNKDTLINPEIMTGFGMLGSWVMLLLALFMTAVFFGFQFLKKLDSEKRQIRLILFCFLWFSFTLSMVLFYPFHKFIYSLTIPLFASALTLSILSLASLRFSKTIFVLFVFLFFYSQLISIKYAGNNHWTVKRGKIALELKSYIDGQTQKNFDTVFIREEIKPLCFYKHYPLSREVAQAVTEDKAIRIWYGKDIEVFYDYKDGYNCIDKDNVLNISALDIYKKAERKINEP